MRIVYGFFICLCVAAAGVFSFSSRPVQPLAQTDVPIEHMRLNHIQRTAAGIIVFGELGHILYNNEQDSTWQTASIDQQRHAMLTDAYFISPQIGVAVGHQGWILRTTDGGKHWQEVQFDGERYDPFLTVQATPEGHLVAAGAFGRMAQSTDNGLSWQTLRAPENTDWHLNTLINHNDAQLLLGEQGVAFYQEHSSAPWQHIEPFYNGSLYGGLALNDGRILAYGMRGNVFVSQQDPHHWQTLNNPIPVSLFTHHVLDANTVLVAGQGGSIFVTDGNALTPIHGGKRWTIMGIIGLADNQFMLATDDGLKQLSLANALDLARSAKAPSQHLDSQG